MGAVVGCVDLVSLTGIERTEVSFPSTGLRCAAWLYRPTGSGPHPIVVLAHGFAFTREARLDAYARRFLAAGLAVLVFDYRHFGASEGQPRQLMDIGRQLGDWRAAITYARGLAGIDGDRVALWGTSFSGGHVAALAAADQQIAAVISQVPYSGLDGRGGLPRPVFLGRMIAAAIDRSTPRTGSVVRGWCWSATTTRSPRPIRPPRWPAALRGWSFDASRWGILRCTTGSGSSGRSPYRPSSYAATWS